VGLAVPTEGCATRATRPPAAWRPLVCALAALCACALILLVDVIRLQRVAIVAGSWEQMHIDFVIFSDSAKQLRAGRSLYEPLHEFMLHDGSRGVYINRNHPALTILFLPLTWLADGPAYVGWTIASLLAFAAALVAALRAVRPAPLRTAPLVVAALVVAFPGMLQAPNLGQVGLILAPTVVGAWLLLRRDRDIPGGLLLGVTIICKPFLLPVVALLLARHRWRAILAVGAGGALLSLLALPYTGIEGYRRWLVALAATANEGGAYYRDPWNIALVGTLTRFGIGVAPLLCTAAPFIATAIGVWWAVRAPAATVAGRDRQFGALLLLALLASPVGWQHYLPLILPTFVIALAAYPSLDTGTRAWLLAGVGCLWLATLRLLLYIVVPDSPLIYAALTAVPTIGLCCLGVAFLRRRMAALAATGGVPT